MYSKQVSQLDSLTDSCKICGTSIEKLGEKKKWVDHSLLVPQSTTTSYHSLLNIYVQYAFYHRGEKRVNGSFPRTLLTLSGH